MFANRGFCSVQNKVKFLNRKIAEKFIRDNNYVLRAYHCNECDHFHLTSREDGGFDKLTKPVVRKRKKPRRLL